jgi:hypothetical protein
VTPYLIVQKKYLHPTVSGGEKTSFTFATDLIVFDDKKLKEYITLRRINGRENRVEGRSPINEKFHRVPAEKTSFGDAGERLSSPYFGIFGMDRVLSHLLVIP